MLSVKCSLCEKTVGEDANGANKHGEPGWDGSLCCEHVRMYFGYNGLSLLPSYAQGCLYHTNSLMADWARRRTIAAPVVPPQKHEAPCRGCTKMNDIGSTKCWWCEGSLP